MTCAKRRVAAFIMEGDRILSHGTNGCRAPQSACPREKGEGYEKCRSVCDQKGHAEVMAIWNAAEKSIDMKGKRIVVVGHHRCCDMCASMIESAGMTVSFA